MSAAGTVGRLARPNISNLQKRTLFKDYAKAFCIAISCSVAFYYGYAEPWRKRQEHEFLTYDPYAEFERMRKLGLFQGAPPDEVIEEMKKKKKYANKFEN